jgi:hypothetical protein
MTGYRIRQVASITLLLGLSLIMASCMSMAAFDGAMQVSQSYDLPNTVDANDVVHAVERSFAHVLLTAPRIVEGALPTPLPDRPPRFTLDSRAIYLDRLGSVLLPTVNCPQNLAVISGRPAHEDSIGQVDQYTACIQPYAGGYRVTIIVSAPRVQHQLRSKPKGEDDFTPVSHIAQALFEEISWMRVASVPDPASNTAHATGGVASLEKDDKALLGKRSSPSFRPQKALAALPLVCLAPKDHAAILQSQPGGGKVVGTVELGAILAVAEPLDTSYFKVESERGPAGWISRSEVERLPCPVG